jgi:hypothetical protein
VRSARPDELDEVGRLTVEVYVAGGHAKPAGTYAAELADAARRARDAELLVAVDASGSAQEMHAAHRLYARLGFRRLPERDWEPVPAMTLLAFGARPLS